MSVQRRLVAADFVSAVGSRTNGSRVWSASLNSDGATYSINLNGVAVWSKVFWPGNSVSAPTDASGSNGDTINIFSPDGSMATVATQQFLATLN
jgi:hypothetical protein